MSRVLDFPFPKEGCKADNWAAWFRLRRPSVRQRAAYHLGMAACAAGERVPLPGGEHQLAIAEGYKLARGLVEQPMVMFVAAPRRDRRRFPKVL